MLIAKTIAEIRDFVEKTKEKNQKIAFVPTMGALHEGHLSLVQQAKELAEVQIVSIFVNQTQFNNQSDFSLYPRHIENDLKLLKPYQISLVFIPDSFEIYPPHFSTKIIPTNLTKCLCGEYRIGHFEGVALILTKFFNLISPNFLLLGKKDFQQFAVVKKLVKDLNFNLEVIGCETIREKSGLARSSRNQLLSREARKKAAKLSQVLQEIREFWQEKIQGILAGQGFRNGFREEKNSDYPEFSRQILKKFLKEKEQEILNFGFSKVDYLEIRDEEKLQLVEDFNSNVSARIFVAAYLEQVRLIDNMSIQI